MMDEQKGSKLSLGKGIISCCSLHFHSWSDCVQTFMDGDDGGDWSSKARINNGQAEQQFQTTSEGESSRTLLKTMLQ